MREATPRPRRFGARDPYGFRPLSIGRLEAGGWVLASETCALDLLGATFIRDVEPGELVSISDSLRSRQRRPSSSCRFRTAASLRHRVLPKRRGSLTGTASSRTVT